MDWYSLTNTRIETIIGERLKKQRLEYNITQNDLAKKTGISRVSISKIERGMGANLSSLIELMRGLRLLENIEQLIPEQEISPIELIKLKNKTKKKRASTKNN
jgi:transcriptional regulator with XRE-family HTH domain